MDIATTACCKRSLLLMVVITTLVFALVALDFYTDYHLLSTYRKTNKVTCAKTILDQMIVATLWTFFFTFFPFNYYKGLLDFFYLFKMNYYISKLENNFIFYNYYCFCSIEILEISLSLSCYIIID